MAQKADNSLILMKLGGKVATEATEKGNKI